MKHKIKVKYPDILDNRRDGRVDVGVHLSVLLDWKETLYKPLFSDVSNHFHLVRLQSKRNAFRIPFYKPRGGSFGL